MAGGFGTRLRPLTNNLPKPMVPIANRPIIEHIIDLLKGHKITDMTTLLYFQPATITDHFGDGKDFGVKIKYTSPTADLGTAGAVAFALREEKKKSTTIIISGDVVTDIDLTKAIAFHKKNKAKATIVLTHVENPLPFGIVITDEAGKIIRFLEKPGWGEVFSDTINTGIYILEQEVIDYIPEDVEFDFSKDLFPKLLEDKVPLYGYVADGYWKDVGSLEEFRASNMDVLHGKVTLNMPGSETSREGVWIGEGAEVDFSSQLKGTVIIGDNCKVSAKAKIKDSVIGHGTVIEEGASISDSVVWDNVRIGQRAKLQENVVSSKTTICSGAHLGVGAIVSDHCRIGRNSTVKANVKVWPHKTVDDDATLATSLIWGQRWAKNIFGTYGVTGLANIELSPEFAAKLGAAYGASFRKGSTVSTSRDVHKTSRMINRAVMTGILSTGVNVSDYGVTPIPVVRYMASNGAEEGGIHTRRSPFNQQIVDLKIFDNLGLDLHPSKEKTIERLFFREDFERVSMDETGELTFPIHGFETYQTAFLSAVDSETINEAAFKVVLDYSYGSTSRVFPSILGGLNTEMIALNANLDATKLTKTTQQFNKSLGQLSTIVRSLSADIGVLFDAGGEKIFLVDEVGDILDTDTSLSLVTLLFLKTAAKKKLKGKIAVPVTASRAIDEMAKTYGYKVVRTKTSARGLMEAANSEDILFVGETSGGYIFPEFHAAFDGMYALVKILEMLATHKVSLHKLLREIPPSIIIKERVSCPWENKGMVMRRLSELAKDKDTILLDGIKINFKNNWIAALPSQDEPYFNIIAEAGTEDAAKKLITKYSEKILKWQGKD
jgi:mannose-1-phosphate guanylyltransferase/phosphomannomutase